MIIDQRARLSNYVAGLQSAGQITFTGGDAALALGIERGAFLDAAERLQKRKLLINPRQDFYVIVPPQFAAWGAPPASWYIDKLMQHEGVPYYVGLLKAAELNGAAHQAVMEFQVVAGKRLPVIKAGRSRIVFYFRKRMDEVLRAVVDRKTDTGAMKVSSPALTALDLLRYPQAAGSTDAIATVMSELADSIDRGELESLALDCERPVVQRLGYLLEWLGHGDKAQGMLEGLKGRGQVPWVELDRSQVADADFVSEPVVRDKRWRVIVRRLPEIDE